MNAIETNSNKKNLQIDFAPMVDLGFLLITFFIFTTKMQESKAFALNMPTDGTGTVTMNSATITLTMKLKWCNRLCRRQREKFNSKRHSCIVRQTITQRSAY